MTVYLIITESIQNKTIVRINCLRYYDSENQILVVKNLPQEKSSIKLYTAEGKLILDNVINEKNGEYSLSTSFLPVGMYFAKVSSSHNRNTHRFAMIR